MWKLASESGVLVAVIVLLMMFIYLILIIFKKILKIKINFHVFSYFFFSQGDIILFVCRYGPVISQI